MPLPHGTGVMLRDTLSRNPLCCVSCNNEVPSERIGFDAGMADKVADWLSVHNSLYRLWLDSGEYESWASARLADPVGQGNIRGHEIVGQLNLVVPAYYWWFVDSEVMSPEDVPACPVCAGPLADVEKRNFRECSVCRVLV